MVVRRSAMHNQRNFRLLLTATHQVAERKLEDLAQPESLVQIHELAPVSNTSKGNRRAGTNRARLAANLLKYEDD
jgi:hypothetical protein